MLLPLSLVFVFLVGASSGSFLNVAITRLPLEKSLVWPSSRCGACLQPIRWYDNLPIISYCWLRGRCRTCGEGYSIVYMLVELGTALAFVGLFWIEVVENIHRFPAGDPWQIAHGWYPIERWIVFAWHATLMSFLIAASVGDLHSREIPLQLTLTGTLIGLIGSAFLAWPAPHAVGFVVAPAVPFVDFRDVHTVTIHHGYYAWPFWLPLPNWFEAGAWQTGLATGVVGALVGTFLLRTVGFLFSTGLGKEALGLGDADLMMMAGAFLGWQIVVVAFFLSVIPALFIGIIQLIVRRDNSLPFGPSLSLSVMATCLAWHTLGSYLRHVFFWGGLLFWLVVASAALLLLLSFLLRLVRRSD